MPSNGRALRPRKRLAPATFTSKYAIAAELRIKRLPATSREASKPVGTPPLIGGCDYFGVQAAVAARRCTAASRSVDENKWAADPKLTQHGQTKAGFSVLVSVVKHESLALVVEHVRVRQALAVPA